MLQLYNEVLGAWTSVNVFGVDGWEERQRRLGAGPAGWKTRRYYIRGGRRSFAEAIAQAARIPAAEAEAISRETLSGWAAHIPPEESEQTAREIVGFWVVLTVVLALPLVDAALVLVVLRLT